ncbi:MAG TPA: 30S ribosomal protein S4 [Candidatus Thermoplasmatota archaeon]|nr:30S ribosomal protein S4 [Candidatus Thermoplasmatota archaeon]
MGDPKFSRRKFEKPNHPWEAERIKEENEIVKKYGLKNKREVWKAASQLRTFRGQARMLLGRKFTGNPQVAREERELLSRLHRLGMVGEQAQLDDVLALNLETVLTRRLETIVYLRGLASTPNQARQLIGHGHIAVNGRILRVPGYIVPRGEEPLVSYAPSSPLTSEAHPVRPKPRPVAAPPSEAPREERPAGRGRPERPRRAQPEGGSTPDAPAPEPAPSPESPSETPEGPQ